MSSLRVLMSATAVLAVTACGGGGASGETPPAPPASFGIALQSVVTGLSAPVYLTAPSGDARLFIVEQGGRIRIVKNGALLAAPFLDLSAKIGTGGERGLLSMAFDPNYTTNGFFYVYYTAPSGDITVERYSRSVTNADQAESLSALQILTVAHRNYSNHNGGQLAFGADGHLYAGTGDGGGGGDPAGNAQNTNVLLGKLLRIDVRNASLIQPYAVPTDNPFAGQAGKRGEIWAHGLRNPWRFAFDGGQVYIADVGQGEREEVNVASTTAGALNYGWNITEGSQCYASSTCTTAGLTPPVLDYAHGASGENGCSITGGFVYRGSAMPEVQGRYFYSDYCKGWLKSFVYRNGAAAELTDWQIANPGRITSFGQDGQRELYMLTDAGTVYRLVRR